jgi:hypothetical protein
LDAVLNTDRLSGAEGTDARENSDQRDRLMNAESPTQMEASNSLQVWLFENLLRAFATGGATYAVVLARLRRLLATGTSPTELLKVVRRSQLIESLPESAQGILALLNDAIRRDAGEAVVSAEVQDAEPQAVAPHEEATEENIARRPTAHDAQIRSYERTQEPERAAAPCVTIIPAADLAAALAAEQRRSRDLGVSLAEKNAVAESSRTQIAEILRDYERQKSEMHTLRDSLAARDTTVLQMQRSLDERDTRLARLQQEHAKLVSTVEAHVETGARLEADLRAARARIDAISAELQGSQEAAARVKRGESRLNAALTELDAVRTRSNSYLELIQTREWRREFNHNMIRELDAQVGAANEGRQALASERDRLQSQLAAADRERARLTAELATRDRALLQAEKRPSSDTQSVEDSKDAANPRQAEQAAQIAELRTEQAAHMVRLHAERAAQIELLQADADRSAELIRVDGDQSTTYVLTERTRIGRAAACELRIESRSVSRQHALVIVGPRDTIIEDLNSTNGVLVNGTRVTRRALSDGDALTIGDTRFRYFARRATTARAVHASAEMLRSEAS